MSHYNGAGSLHRGINGVKLLRDGAQQVPFWQENPLRQLLRYMQPASGSQPSLIKHADESSSQTRGAPAPHVPLPLQYSPEVHWLPSSQEAPDGLYAYLHVPLMELQVPVS
jgi:hypothetical protein